MEGDGCSESALPNAPLLQPDEYLESVIFEPVPAAETALEPDPDVVLENLFRNSAGTRRKSSESRRKSARRRRKTVTLPPMLPKIVCTPHNKICNDYVQEISSDSDGSTPNKFPLSFPGVTVRSKVSVPTPKNPTNFEFVTGDLSRNPTGRGQLLLEEDPLACDEPVPGEGAVPDPLSSTPLVPVSQDATFPPESPFNAPVSNRGNPAENEHPASLDVRVPGCQSLNGTIDMVHKLINSATVPHQTTNITISTALEPPSTTDSSTRNVQNSDEFEEDNFFEVEIRKGPPKGPEIDALQSVLSSANILAPDCISEVLRPISLPAGNTLTPIPSNILSVKSSNDLERSGSQSDKPEGPIATSTTNFFPTSPRPSPISLPGGTMAPIPYSVISRKFSNNLEGAQDTEKPFPSRLPNSIQPGSNVVVVLMPDGQLARIPLQSLNQYLLDDGKTSLACYPDLGTQPGKALENPLATSTTSTAKPKKRPRKLRSNVSPSNPKTPNRFPAIPLSGSWTNPDPRKPPAIPLSDSWTNPDSPKPPTVPLSGSWTNPDSPKPSTTFQASEILLSGSWSNPNSPNQSIISDPLKLEKDPLEGPEQDVSSIGQNVFPCSDSSNLQHEGLLLPADNAIGTAAAIDTFLDKPSVPVSNPLKRPSQPHPLWPPPNMRTRRRKRKLMPKIPQPVAEIQLSGSWTNPNPKPSIEKDPLEGPVHKIIPWTGDDNLNGHYETLPLSSYAKRTKSTQCNSFTSAADDVSLREVAGLETPDLSRPIVNIRGYGIDVPAKQMVYNLYKYLEHRKITYNLRYISSDLVQVATGVKSGTVRRILREAKKTCHVDDFQKMPKFAPVVRRRNRVKYIFSNLRIDMALRECMIEHFLKKKEALALAVLKKKCHSVFGPKSTRYGSNFLRLRIKTLGFVSMRTVRRKIHVEGAAVRAWRHKYLTQLNRLLEEKKNIVFTLVVNMLEVPRTTGEEWVITESEDEIKHECRVLTVFHAANKTGYVDEGFCIKDAVRNQLNATEDNSYCEWLELNVLQKIPKDSVVVLAHQRFHNMKDTEIRPNQGSSKKQIIDWLHSRVVGDFDETLPKCVLLDKVSRIPVERGYSIDSLVKTYGHTPVHLFPHQRDLNPLEYVWEGIRSKIQKQGKLKFNKDQLRSAFDSNAPIFEFSWKRYKTWGDYYIKRDPLLEEAQEVAIRNLGGVWSPLITENPDEVVGEENLENELEEDLASEKSPAKSNKSESDSDSNSDSDSDLDSSQSDSDSDSDSDDTGSESEDGVPLSEQINGNKSNKIKTAS